MPSDARTTADPRDGGRRRARPLRVRGGAPRAGGAGAASAPASRSRSRRATPASCCRARAGRRSTGSRSSTRPGLIDAGYRGEVRVLLLNTDREEAFEIVEGDRIAQLLVVAVRRRSSRSGPSSSPGQSAARAASAPPGGSGGRHGGARLTTGPRSWHTCGRLVEAADDAAFDMDEGVAGLMDDGRATATARSS